MVDQFPDKKTHLHLVKDPRQLDLSHKGKALRTSASARWYTPIPLVDAARTVLGSIDLDAASDDFGQSRIQANRFYSAAEDGLGLDWYAGSVFVNPPGSKTGEAAEWWAKATREFSKGAASRIFFVCFSLNVFQTSQRKSAMGHPLDYTYCIPDKRVAYKKQHKKKSAPTHPSAFILLANGNDYAQDRFFEVFESWGYCRRHR